MALTPEDKQRIREEEEERARAQADIKQKKVRSNTKGCMWLIAAPFILFFVIYISSDPPTQKTKELVALKSVAMNSYKKVISNRSKYPSKADFHVFDIVTEVKEWDLYGMLANE